MAFFWEKQKTSTIINQNMPKKIQWYPILPDDQMSAIFGATNQVSMHSSPHQVHDATVGATSQDGPKMMGLGYPVDAGLRYAHFLVSICLC